MRTLPSPFADPVSPSSASLRAPQQESQLDVQQNAQQGSQPALRQEMRSQLGSDAITVPPSARLSAMVAAAIGATDGGGASTAGPGRRSLRRASGSTGSMPTVPSGGMPPRGPMRRTRSTAAGVATTSPPRRSTSGSPKCGALGPLGAPSRSSEDSGKSTPATGGSLRLSDSASSYDLDAAVSGLSTTSSTNAAAPRQPSPLRRSAGLSRPPHAATSFGVACTLGFSTRSASAWHGLRGAAVVVIADQTNDLHHGQDGFECVKSTRFLVPRKHYNPLPW